MIRWLKTLLAAGSLSFLAACGGGTDAPNLSYRLNNDPQFSLLAEAVQTAGLRNTLASGGPFTLLAPTNTAFAALLTELGVSKEQLFADRELLTAVLTYHLLPSSVPSGAVPLGRALTTVQGGVFKIEAGAGGLAVTDGRNRVTRISATDLEANNGVIHTVDRVLLPADRNIVQTAQGITDFSILVDAAVAAGLVDALSAPGPLTVFAPTNAAFAALLAELGVSKDQLLANTPLLTQVLTYHVLPGRALRADIVPGTALDTLQGSSFEIDADLVITDGLGRTSNILATDVFASNGVVHVIDRVLRPAPQ
jgi:uncharacterized surface protein with fasciclin (FAS1) repeats